MKKLLLLIVPVVFFMTACDNKVAPPAEPVVIRDTIIVHDTIYATAPKVKAGAPGMPAQVFDDLTRAAIKGASVVAKRDNNTVETVTSDAAGHYEYTRLVTGTSYAYTASKTGYKTQTITAIYEGIASLPEFDLKK